MSRQVNIKTKEFQSTEKGSIITDPRKFGVELEVIAKKEASVIELANQISESFGFHHDGSVKGKSGDIGVEIVTPILSGKVGETALKDLLDKMNKLGFETNYSCGLHVHHDAQNLLPSSGVVVEKGNFHFYEPEMGYRATYQAKLYKLLKKIGISDDKLIDVQNFSKQIRLKLKDGSTLLARSVKSVDKNIVFYQYGNYNFVAPREIAKQIYDIEDISSVASNDDVMISKKYGKPHVVKDIMFFYTVFTDVLLAMLPEERRENQKFSSNGRNYCQKLSDRISPFDIMRCDTMDDLEKLWLKTSDKNEIHHKKNSQYDESRYYGVNFHSLFAKYGTIEIRWHEGTTNPLMILYWIAIHQHILRKIEMGDLSTGSIRGVLGLFNLESKIEYFFDVLDLPKHLEKYIRHRLEFYTLNK